MQRQQQIHAWLLQRWPRGDFTLSRASADASFRRYFRVRHADGASHVVMDAPPQHEDCAPWLRVRQLLAAAGVHVPEVLAQHAEAGFLLLSDLGDTTYLAALSGADPAQARRLYGDALESLVAIQRSSAAGLLPDYDAALLGREMALFPDWYVARHHGLTLAPAERAALDALFARIAAVNLAEAKVFVHRDYHARNLMYLPGGAPGNPGIIDFQDAVYGPLSYDLVSLFKDAYIAWDEEVVLDWLIGYWENARRAGLPVPADFAQFHRDFEWMGVQRHLKVLGIFARLCHRDGKRGYLADMPRVAGYLRAACTRYDALHPIVHLLDRLEQRAVQVGYSF